MVGSWIDEKRAFRPGVFPNVSRTGNWDDVAHYTQLIWKGTTRVGCAIQPAGRWDYPDLPLLAAGEHRRPLHALTAINRATFRLGAGTG